MSSVAAVHSKESQVIFLPAQLWWPTRCRRPMAFSAFYWRSSQGRLWKNWITFQRSNNSVCVCVCMLGAARAIVIIMSLVMGPSRDCNCPGLCSSAPALRTAGAGKMRRVPCLEEEGKRPCASEKVTSPIQQTNTGRYWSQLSWASHFLGRVRLKV